LIRTSEVRNFIKDYAFRLIGRDDERLRRLTTENRTLLEKEATLRRALEKTAAVVRIEQENLRSFVEQAPVAMCLLEGPDYRYTLTNAMYQTLVGNRNVIGNRIRDELPGLDARFFEALDQVYRTGTPFYGKDIKINSDRLDFVYHPWLTVDGTVKGVLVAASDVSERFAARKVTDDVIVKLKAERDLRERFVSALTHDMRTPMTAAKISAQLMGRKFSTVPDIQKGVNRIVRSLDRADEMIRDLLDANQIEVGGKVLLSLQECNLTKLLQTTVAELVVIHGDRFIIECPEVDFVGRWDSAALQRVVENLANNAIKYGKPAGTVTLRLTRSEGDAVLAVHNDGDPISEADQLVLFEHLRRSRSAQDGLQKGWGIGLTLVRGLTEAHGGSVAVESNAPAGTTFFVRIPKANGASHAP
jgi:signal transduction histidine kinase